MTTVTEMIVAVGQLVDVKFESFWIPCKITDVKNSWGVNRIQIQPLHGTGSQWVQLDRCRPATDPWAYVESVIANRRSLSA